MATRTTGPPTTGTAASSPPPCGTAHSHTLAVDRVARVYVSGSAVLGCARGGRSYRLGSGGRSLQGQKVGPVALSGRAVAYGLTQSGVDTVLASVVVRRLGDGAVLHDEPATSRPVGPESFEAVDSVVVRPDGAAAWISSSGSVASGRAREVEVDRVDRGGHTLLDSGTAIDPRSLRISGSRVSWRHGSVTRSARLH